MNWYLEVLKKYVVFSGRARRVEFWMFWLVSAIILFVLTVIEDLIGIAPESDTSFLGTIYLLATAFPNCAVSVRRLHDTGRSGSWVAIAMVPFIGIVVLLLFMMQDSEPGENRYGPNPKGEVAPTAVEPRKGMRLNAWTVVLLLLAVAASLGLMVIGGGRMIADELKAELHDNVVLTDQLGEVQKFDLDWKATWDRDTDYNVSIFNVEGTKGRGVLAVNSVTVDDGSEEIQWARLTLPSGEKRDLFPEHPAPTDTD